MKSPQRPALHEVPRFAAHFLAPALALILSLPPNAFAQPVAAPAPRALTAAEWREDLRFLAENLPKVHKNLFHTMTREEFDAAVKALDADIPSLDDYAIYIRLVQLCARIQDGHSRLVRGASDVVPGSRLLSVRFVRYADGIYVQGAAPEYAAAVGGKLVGVGPVGWEEALKRMATLTPHDPGNDGLRLWNATVNLAHTRSLRGLGLGSSDSTADITIEKAGKRRMFAMKGGVPTKEWFTSNVPTGWIDARPASAPVPLSIQHADEPQWITFVPEHRAVYFQFNDVRNGEQETFAQVAERLKTMLEGDGVDRLVIDLRNNGGGDNTLLRPLLLTLIRCRQNRRGGMVALIGPRTFSAAQNFTNRLESYTETIFLGEPTGQNVNFYGDTNPIWLPHSRLVAYASWLWWQDKDPRDDRPFTAPEVAAHVSFRDYVAGRDPALELALSMPTPPSMEQWLEAGLPGGADTLLARYDAWIADPAHAYLTDPESQVNDYACGLMGAKRLREAVAVFDVNARRHPKSANAFDSLGEACIAAGDTAKAVESYRRSVELDPANESRKSALERLTRR